MREDRGRVWKGRGSVGVGERMEDNVLARGVISARPRTLMLCDRDLDVRLGDLVGEIVCEVFGY